MPEVEFGIRFKAGKIPKNSQKFKGIVSRHDLNSVVWASAQSDLNLCVKGDVNYQ